MEHVFSMQFARDFILQEKKFCSRGGKFLQEKKLFVNATFLLALCARPYPLPLKLVATNPGARGSCGQRGQPDPSHMATQTVDNVDNHFSFVHMTHKPFFFFAWEFPARGFVDNVDNVDARFKLVADEAST